MTWRLKDFLNLIWYISREGVNDPKIMELGNYYKRLPRDRKVTLRDHYVTNLCQLVYPKLKKPRFLKMKQKEIIKIKAHVRSVSNYVQTKYPIIHTDNTELIPRRSDEKKLTVRNLKHICRYIDMVHEDAKGELNGVPYIQTVPSLFI